MYVSCNFNVSYLFELFKLYGKDMTNSLWKTVFCEPKNSTYHNIIVLLSICSKSTENKSMNMYKIRVQNNIEI